MTDKPTTAQELEELFGKVDWEKVLKDKIVSIIKEDENKRLMTTLYGSSFADIVTGKQIGKNIGGESVLLGCI